MIVQFYLDMMQKRLASDDSNMLTFNRSVIHDMLAVFGRQNGKYQEYKEVLKIYSCDCAVPCIEKYTSDYYCGFRARELVEGEKDGSDEATA